jgi:protocatechuate 3,4-dioxygenase beta subunit
LQGGGLHSEEDRRAYRSHETNRNDSARAVHNADDAVMPRAYFNRTTDARGIAARMDPAGHCPKGKDSTMPKTKLQIWNRRRFILASALMPAAAVLAVKTGQPALAAATLKPTPACGDVEVTPQQTAGPFFTPASPERTSLLEPGTGGTRFVLAGLVLTSRCAPVANAFVDFWHADADGRYDNQGFRLRGHQYTDTEGRYSLETIVPGNYGPRTRHYHVKVQAPGRPVLTTQLYFPGEERNETDFLFRPDLLMATSPVETARHGRFDFVLDLG